MNTEAISLVRNSWDKVLPIQDVAAKLFYDKLFELDPSLKPLFKGDMAEQGRKLMSMITLVVGRLDRLEPLIGAVQDLGRRHAGYGVKDEHYDTVAAALLDTLGKGLGEGFTQEVKLAWTEAYILLATAMKAASKTVA